MASAKHRGWLLNKNSGILAGVYNGAQEGSSVLATNTALGGVLVGTPVTPALAVDSLVISNTVASGDLLIALNNGGNSQAWLWIDASAGTLTLYGAGTAAAAIASTYVEVKDDILLGLGTGRTSRLSYDTTDANANATLWQLPAGGATDVPVIAIGQSIESVDLGLYNGVVDPRIALFGVGAVATGPVLEFRKARGTVASPTVVTTADDMGSIDFYGAVAAGEYVRGARILAEMTGTIATGRGPGVLTFQTATDAETSVLTTALQISAAQLVTCAAGLTLTTGDLTFGAAADVRILAATAAALEFSDGTTKFYAIDTRVATAGVTTHTLNISAYTFASASGALATALSLAAHTLNYTGATQVTSAVNTASIGARTIAGDTATLTVDQANSLRLAAPVEGTNVAITAASAIRIADAGGTPVNQYGIYIEALTAGATADYAIWVAGASPVHLGTAGTATGALEIAGSTSGVVTMTVAVAAGTWTITLPTTGGTNGYSLTTDGSGVTTWTNIASVRDAKVFLPEIAWLRPEDALDALLSTRVPAFHYKPGRGTGDTETIYHGVIADEAPWAMHYSGGVLNPANTFGYTVLGFQAMAQQIKALEARVATLSMA